MAKKATTKKAAPAPAASDEAAQGEAPSSAKRGSVVKAAVWFHRVGDRDYAPGEEVTLDAGELRRYAAFITKD